MPYVASYSVRDRYRVGDLVYRIFPNGALEGPYVIGAVPESGKYRLCAKDGSVVLGGELFLEEQLDLGDISGDTGATENATTAAASTSQHSPHQTGEIHDDGTASERRSDTVLPDDTHPAVSSIDLSASLWKRYEQTGSIDNLNEVTQASKEALAITPPNHPDQTASLNNLSLSLWRRYERTGSINNLDQAIQALKEALAITSPNHHYRVGSLNNLSVSLWRRYERTGSINNLDEAIQASEDALAITSLNHPDRAASLNNLGIYLTARYQRDSLMSNLDRAIEALTEAARIIPKEDPSRPGWLTNLGVAIGTRFKETGAIRDLEQAIRILTVAIGGIPKEHPSQALLLNNLGSYLGRRYELLGSVDDINHAVEAATAAVENIPEDHPDRASFVRTLEMLRGQRETGTTGSFNRPLIPPASLDEIETTTSKGDSIFSQKYTSTHYTNTTGEVMDITETGRKPDISESAKMELVVSWVDEQQRVQDVGPTAESVTFIRPFDDPISSAVPDTLARISHGPVPEQHVNPETDDLDRKVVSDWEMAAWSRATRFLDKVAQSSDSPSLSEVVRDRIWPFYANWLHEPLGPCTRTVEFDGSDEGDVTSVTIYITCKSLPQPWLQRIIKDCTYFLVPDEFKGDDQVVVRIGQGISTRSCSTIEILNTNAGLVDLKMGDGIMSSVAARVNGDLVVSEGSSGPWLRTSSSNVFLYTNEHVVRRGTTNGHMLTITYPGRIRVGEVVLTSGEAGQNKDDATMKCNNPDVHEKVRKNNAFLADWAIVKFEKAPTKPIETPVARSQGLCLHINGIIHIPRRGKAVAKGAGRRKLPGEPWTAAYTTHIQGDGMPTVLSPGMFGDNSKDLACWSLSRPKRAPYDELDWYENGIGQPGDSGAGVVDDASGRLCGLIVGQTKHETFKHRTAHMIDLMDVIIDTMRASKAEQAKPDIADFYTAELIQCNCAPP